jgi:hypothetical protein
MQPISQSFIKELFEYKMKNGCGLQFEARYVNGMEFPSSAAMNLGSWFEYQCTGQTTKFGHIPEPVRLKPKKLTKKELDSGLKQEDQVGALSKKYADALVHVARFKQMMEDNEYEIVDTGATLEDKVLGAKGDVDIIVKKRGEEKVRFIDTKFSGLIDNKWDDLGWADESLEYKDKLMIQAVHYKMLGKAVYGYEPDFYFWVFSSTNTTECKNIKVVVNEDRFNEHKVIIGNARAEFERNQESGWIPRPNPKRCGSCPLSDTCPHQVELPTEQVVYY